MIIKSLDDVKDLNPSTEIPSLIFRGQTNSEWPLVPKLFREKPSIIKSAKYEIACYRPYINSRAKYYIHYNSPIEHLINLQHYNGSTRLLDFTTNFYTSIFFACYDPFSNNNEKNGKVFVLHRDFFPTYYSQAFNFYYIESVKKELYRLKDADSFYLVDPEVKNPRMKRQDGLFLLFPLAKLDGYEFDIPVKFEDFVEAENLFSLKRGDSRPFWYAHIEIDSNSKENILKQLDNEFGINPETIFEHAITTEEIKANYKSMLEEIELFYNDVLLK